MIKKGDLVMIVRAAPCCGANKSVGAVFIAGEDAPHVLGHCGACGSIHDEGRAVWGYKHFGAPVSRLTKIDPPPIHEQIIEEAVA